MNGPGEKRKNPDFGSDLANGNFQQKSDFVTKLFKTFFPL